MFGLSQIQTYIIVAGLAVTLVGGAALYTFNKGERAGAADVKAKVAVETVRTLDKARTEKERANSDVRDKPIDAVVDGLK